jgi:GTP-binding protein
MIEKFIDIVELELNSGNGGAGVASFRREKYLPKGGPDGGDGGDGGNVVFLINPQLNNFSYLKGKRKFKAKNVSPGKGKRCFGKDGSDLIIEVPPGTILKTKGEIMLHDFDSLPQKYIFLKGGKGGLGNYHFKNSIRQKPTYAQKGLAGEKAQIILEIKLIADIGLVGYPNVGKSTLLSVLTKARPKIGSYPFTTLTPNLGVFMFPQGYSLVIADIPGIIDNAHQGHGLGLEFLRHIERTLELFFLIDSGSSHPYQDFRKLRYELKQYSKKLFSKKFYILITKKDLLKNTEKIINYFPISLHNQIFFISSFTNEGFSDLKKLLGKIWKHKNQQSL